MKYIEPINVEKAKALAAYLHSGQMRRKRELYYNHLLRVSAQVTEWGLDEDTIIAALLHDSIEDTSVSLELLRNFPYRISEKTLTLIEMLAHLPQETYDEYIERLLSVGKDKYLREVLSIKLADLNDNSNMHPQDSSNYSDWEHDLGEYMRAKVNIIHRLNQL